MAVHKCKTCGVDLDEKNSKAYDIKKSYYVCIDCKRDYNRETMIHSHGKKITGLHKRPYPSGCEMCSKKRKLAYHHWGKDYNIGVWVCWRCHRLAEAADMEGDDVGSHLQRYLDLKEQINSQSKLCLEKYAKT